MACSGAYRESKQANASLEKILHAALA